MNNYKYKYIFINGSLCGDTAVNKRKYMWYHVLSYPLEPEQITKYEYVSVLFPPVHRFHMSVKRLKYKEVLEKIGLLRR